MINEHESLSVPYTVTVPLPLTSRIPNIIHKNNFKLCAGYKADEISILTTYNGQKHLIRDVVKQRCGDNPIFGFPKTITTVDRYQVRVKPCYNDIFAAFYQ